MYTSTGRVFIFVNSKLSGNDGPINPRMEIQWGQRPPRIPVLCTDNLQNSSYICNDIPIPPTHGHKARCVTYWARDSEDYYVGPLCMQLRYKITGGTGSPRWDHRMMGESKIDYKQYKKNNETSLLILLYILGFS